MESTEFKPYTPLSEEDVKKAMLPFLKEFYKYRFEYKPDTLQSSLNNRTESGIVADGLVTFHKDNGEPFTCAYEATSSDKLEEVKFGLNGRLFLWDCIAFAASFCAIAYAYLYLKYFAFLNSLRLTGNLGLLIGLGMISFFCWYILMRGWKRYRHIFAIEQFKLYYADEQWVAIADDVFPTPLDPYFVELKNQCVYNGFGLVMLGKDGLSRPIATPTRASLYGKDRKMVDFLTEARWYQNMAQMAANRPKMPDYIEISWNTLFRPVSYYLIDPLKKFLWDLLIKPFAKNTATIDTYIRSFANQKLVAFLSTVVVSALLVNNLKHRDIIYEDADQWKGVIGAELEKNQNPEDMEGYVVDEMPPTEKRRDANGIAKQDPDPIYRSTESVNEIDLSDGKSDAEVPETAEKPVEHSSSDNERPYTEADETREHVAPTAMTEKGNCPAIVNAKGWIVQDNFFSTRDFAEDRLKQLKFRGLKAAILPMYCLTPGKSGFIVYFTELFPEERSARQQLESLQLALKRYGLTTPGKPFLRRLN